MALSAAAGGRADGVEVFSGHESFACRYGWLPKLHEAVCADPELFADDERAMAELGLGKNMVRSIRFWGDAFGLTRAVGRRLERTALAARLLDQERGRDPYLEDAGSLWRLHWVVTARAALGAWCVAFLDLRDSEVARDRLVESVRARAAVRARGPTTAGTAAAHVDVMLRTYDAARPRGGVLEDGLGSPFQELGILEMVDMGGTPTVRFRRGPKAGLDAAAFAFALHDFWRTAGASDRTLPLRSVMLDRLSPGVVFRLDERTGYRLVTELCGASGGRLVVREDGAGGMDLVAVRGGVLELLEEMAWA